MCLGTNVSQPMSSLLEFRIFQIERSEIELKEKLLCKSSLTFYFSLPRKRNILSYVCCVFFVLEVLIYMSIFLIMNTGTIHILLSPKGGGGRPITFSRIRSEATSTFCLPIIL